MTNFRPSDADDIVEKEFAGVEQALKNKLLSFNFSALRDGTERPAPYCSSFQSF
jgi:hypothetical protein